MLVGDRMSGTMRAVVLERPGDPDELRIREIPIPEVTAGQVLIQVRAFGLNRSELHFRSGVASSGSFPEFQASRRPASSRRRPAVSSGRAPRR